MVYKATKCTEKFGFCGLFEKHLKISSTENRGLNRKAGTLFFNLKPEQKQNSNSNLSPCFLDSESLRFNVIVLAINLGCWQKIPYLDKRVECYVKLEYQLILGSNSWTN